MPKKAFAVAVTMMSVLCLEVEAQNADPVIVVRTAENPINYHIGTIGNTLADMLIGVLSRTGTLTIVDGRHPLPSRSHTLRECQGDGFQLSRARKRGAGIRCRGDVRAVNYRPHRRDRRR